MSFKTVIIEKLDKILKPLTVDPDDLIFTEEKAGLNEHQILVSKKVLKAFNLTHKMYKLSRSDLQKLCYGVGLNCGEDLIESKLGVLGLRLKENFKFNEFLHLWKTLLPLEEDVKKLNLRAFQFFDQDNNGFITIIELKRQIALLNGSLSNVEIDKFIQLTTNGCHDGLFDYEDFFKEYYSYLPSYLRC